MHKSRNTVGGVRPSYEIYRLEQFVALMVSQKIFLAEKVLD